ncbi:MAG: acyl carrier protein [Mycobacteriales bacterium]
MRSRQEIVEQVRSIAAGETGIPVEELSPELDLRKMEGVDSVKVLRVVARIERDYDVELSDEQVFSFASVSDVADAVVEALRTAGAAP